MDRPNLFYKNARIAHHPVSQPRPFLIFFPHAFERNPDILRYEQILHHIFNFDLNITVITVNRIEWFLIRLCRLHVQLGDILKIAMIIICVITTYRFIKIKIVKGIET